MPWLTLDLQVRIVQRGAVRPLIAMLEAPDSQLKEMAAFALGRLAQVMQASRLCKLRSSVMHTAKMKLLLLCHILACSRAHCLPASSSCGGVVFHQNSDNQAGIVHDGGLRPLLELLESKNGNLQHNAAFALYGLADNTVSSPALEHLPVSLLWCLSPPPLCDDVRGRP